MFLTTSCWYHLLAGYSVGVVMNVLTNRTLLYRVSPWWTHLHEYLDKWMALYALPTWTFRWPWWDAREPGSTDQWIWLSGVQVWHQTQVSPKTLTPSVVTQLVSSFWHHTLVFKRRYKDLRCLVILESASACVFFLLSHVLSPQNLFLLRWVVDFHSLCCYRRRAHLTRHCLKSIHRAILMGQKFHSWHDSPRYLSGRYQIARIARMQDLQTQDTSQ